MAVLLVCVESNAADAPAFPFDAAKAPIYLNQTRAAAANGSAKELRAELSSTIDEILDGPWQPLYSDYSAAQAGGVGPAEWCFNRPGEYLLTLAYSAPYMTEPQKTKAREFLSNLVSKFPPTQQLYVKFENAKPRNFRKTPPPNSPTPNGPESERLRFAEAYALWAYANAFDAWPQVLPLFNDLKSLRAQLEARGDFAPAYKPEHAGPLSADDAKNPEYRFMVYQALRSGFQDNYWYHGARQARERLEKDKPLFFPVRTLTALLGYYRLAKHFGDDEQTKWAAATFAKVAGICIEQKSSPYLWSDHTLCPEVGRLIRDSASSWLDELQKTPSVGDLPATDWNHKLVAGKRDFYAMNAHTWFHAWGGQGEGIRPRTVMGAFLANAYLFNAPPETIAQTRDIPWCKADLYYAQKLVAAIRFAEAK